MRHRRNSRVSVGPSLELRFNTTDGKVACCGRSVVVWDLESRVRLEKFHPFKHPSHIDWSPAQSILAAKSTAGDLVVIDTDEPSKGATSLRRRGGEGCEVAFSPCGRFLVDCNWNGRVDVFSHRTGEVVLSESVPHAMITTLAYSRSRELFAYVVGPKATSQTLPPSPDYIVVRKWPFWEHEAIVLPHGPQNIEAVAFSPDERRLLLSVSDLGCSNPRLQLRDIADNSVDAEAGFHFYASGKSVAWSPRTGLIANVEMGGVRLYDAELRSSLAFLPVEYPSHVEFSNSGAHLGVGAWGKGFVCSPDEILLDLPQGAE